jgi:hypothetical protein
MPMTTIRVSTETRDRLEAQASAAQVSLGEHLARLASAADRGMRFEAPRAAAVATPSDLTPEDDEWLDADLGT